jgi:hypothetical protein
MMKRIAILLIGIVFLAAFNAFSMNMDDMTLSLDKVKKSVTAVFSSIDKELANAASQLSVVNLDELRARKILNDLSKAHGYIIDCAFVDAAGKMVIVEPKEYNQFEAADISKQKHVMVVKQLKKPVLSSVFRSVEGIEAIDFEYPVFSGKGDFTGSVSMLVRQDALFGDTAMPFVWDKSCKVWVMQKDGLIVYDPDPDQVGRNVFSDRFFESFDDLISFSRTVASAKSGGGSYDFYAKGFKDTKVVKKYAVWDTVSLYGTEWRVIVMEAEKPIVSVINQ